MANNRRKKNSAKLRWDSKPRRAPNPKDIEFQTAEVVIPNPYRDEAQLPFSFRDELLNEKELDKKRINRLIWGDNLLGMQALLASGYEKSINLIYIDPPFWSGEKYNFQASIEIPNMGKSDRQWAYVETLAYKDTWTGGIDSYLDMLYPRLQLMKRLLSDNGSIYIHLDWHVEHYIKVIMDEIFGTENFRNEIVWVYSGATSPGMNIYARRHDNILWYTRSENYIFKADEIRQQYSEASKKMEGKKKIFHHGKKPVIIELSRKGKFPEDWIYIPTGVAMITERVGFDTQKPEKLLKRIILASSNPGDLVADFFCGSGTLGSVIEKLNRENSTKPPRQWIMCDLSKVAIQVSRARLVNLDAKPFLIENIGNYQREMIYLHGARIYEMQRIILKLYGATPREERNDLGIRKSEDGKLELVYVGYPDRAVTAGKVEELEKTAETLDGMGYRKLIILAWDYEYNYSELLENRKKASKREWKAEIESKMIPPEIYEYLKKAKDEEEIESLKDKIYFYEKPYLKLLEPKTLNLPNGKVRVTIGLKNYVLFDFPVKKEKDREEIRKIAKDNFASLIDFWAVDWDYDGFTFKSQWQAFRGFGKKIKIVPVKVSKELEKGKEYNIAVRVVDIFGNDATGIVKTDLRGE